MDQTTMVHLHNGILHSGKKVGIPMLHNSMDGTGEYYAKWNKSDSERQIPYDLTYKWNLNNKTNKWAKYKHRHGNKEQTDSNQRGEGEGDNGANKGKGHQGTCIKDPWKKTIEGRIECGRYGVGSAWESNGGKIGTTVIEQQ